jgi:hypothetical protein
VCVIALQSEPPSISLQFVFPSLDDTLARCPFPFLAGGLADGVGLFLLGMWLMTDGLKLAAGPALERILARSSARLAAPQGTSARALRPCLQRLEKRRPHGG